MGVGIRPEQREVHRSSDSLFQHLFALLKSYPQFSEPGENGQRNLRYVVDGSGAIACWGIAVSYTPIQLITDGGDPFERFGDYQGARIQTREIGEAIPIQRNGIDESRNIIPPFNRLPEDIDILPLDNSTFRISKRRGWDRSALEKTVFAQLPPNNHEQAAYGIDASQFNGRLVSACQLEILHQGEKLSVIVDSPDSIIHGKILQLLSSFNKEFLFQEKRFPETSRLVDWGISLYSYKWIEDLVKDAITHPPEGFLYTYLPFSSPDFFGSAIGKMLFENLCKYDSHFTEIINLVDDATKEKGADESSTEIKDYAMAISGRLNLLKDGSFRLARLIDQSFLRAGGGVKDVMGFLEVIRDMDSATEALELYKRIEALVGEEEITRLPIMSEDLPWIQSPTVRSAVSDMIFDERLTPDQKLQIIWKLTNEGVSAWSLGDIPFNIRKKGDDRDFTNSLVERRNQYFTELAQIITNSLESNDPFKNFVTKHQEFASNYIS